METIRDAATVVVLVLAVFAGVAIPRAYRLDRRDADEATKNEQSKGDNSNE